MHETEKRILIVGFTISYATSMFPSCNYFTSHGDLIHTPHIGCSKTINLLQGPTNVTNRAI